MTITFTRAQVAKLLRILAPDIVEQDRLAIKAGIGLLAVTSVLNFGDAPCPQLLRFLDLTARRGRYEWRVE